MLIEDSFLYADLRMCTNFSEITERKWNGRVVTLPKEPQMRFENILMSSKNSIGGSLEGRTDIEGNSSVEVEIHASIKDDDREFTMGAEGSIKNDGEGHFDAEIGVKFNFNIEF